MPELPEVETLRRQLQELVCGERVCSLDVRDPKLGELPSLAGARIEAVVRLGKWLKFELSRAREAWLHLRMTGRLLWQESAAEIPAHTRLTITLSSGRLHLIDPRRFAVFLARPPRVTASLLPDPLAGLDARLLAEAACGRRMPVKSFLMDQRFLAGIGNIYACEILAEAAVHPQRPAGGLALASWKAIAAAAAIVLPRAVACRGTTVSDWRDLFGRSGTNQDHLKVYSRQGKPCLRCGGEIERLVMAGRGTWFCPSCQK